MAPLSPLAAPSSAGGCLAAADPAADARPIPGITQPVPAPRFVDEYWLLVEAGVLIDLAGRPLRWRSCPLCGTRVVPGTTCPLSLPCPQCGARAGRRRCLRPSGHEAAQWHTARVRAAERIDESRIAAGAVFFPAPWPRPVQGELFDLHVAH